MGKRVRKRYCCLRWKEESGRGPSVGQGQRAHGVPDSKSCGLVATEVFRHDGGTDVVGWRVHLRRG